MGAVFPLSTLPTTTMTTIADIQSKLLKKMDNKFKNGNSERCIRSVLGEFDGDHDGFISYPEFYRAIELVGNALNEQEAQFLFLFWDTMAGKQEERGVVEVAVAVADLLATLPEFGNGFNSGEEPYTAPGAKGKGNLPSQSGGIFAGGSYVCGVLIFSSPACPPNQIDFLSHAGFTLFRRYAADAAGAPPPGHGGVAASHSTNMPLSPSKAVPSSRPKGNESSVPGGIFQEASAAEKVVPSSGARANRSNASSVPGGIFSTESVPAPPVRQRPNSNISSVPGGIFG